MIISIHQPHFFPWLGYFHKILTSECFVYLDNVQYRKNYFQNRTQIKNITGQPLWLTIPVQNSSLDKLICETSIASVHQPQKLVKTLYTCYGKTPYYKELSDGINEILIRSYESLSKLNLASVQHVFHLLNLENPFYIASDLKLTSEDPNERILEICKKLGATKYLAGKGGANYMDVQLFQDNGIEVIWQKFNPAEFKYQQISGSFQAGLSVLDALFNIGPEQTLKLLKRNYE